MPTGQSLHVQAIDPALTMYAEGVAPEISQKYIAGGACPIMPTAMKSNKYRTFPRSPFIRGVAAPRRPHTKSAEISFEWSTDNYSTENYSTSFLLSQEEIDDSDNPELLQQLATSIVVNGLLVRQELAFAAKFMTTSVWGTDKTGVTDFPQWDDFTNSDPVANVLAWARIVDVNGGLKPNTMIVGPDVHRALKQHPAIINRMSVTGLRVATEEILAQLFEVDKYFVAGAKKVTSAEGIAEASATFDYIYGKTLLLAYMGKSGPEIGPSAARIFTWQKANAGAPSANGIGSIPIKRIVREETNDFKLEGSINFDQKVTSSKLAVFATAVTAN